MIDRGMWKNSLALACAMNSHFRRFNKSMKIYCEIHPQSHPKLFKTGPWGGQGRFIDHSYWFWAVSKNRCFLMSSSRVQKLITIEPWGAKGPPSAPQLVGSGDFWDRGPRGASRVELLNNKITGKWCVIWHADGRWPSVFFVWFILQLAKSIYSHVWLPAPIHVFTSLHNPVFY